MRSEGADGSAKVHPALPHRACRLASLLLRPVPLGRTRRTGTGPARPHRAVIGVGHERCARPPEREGLAVDPSRDAHRAQRVAPQEGPEAPAISWVTLEPQAGVEEGVVAA